MTIYHISKKKERWNAVSVWSDVPPTAKYTTVLERLDNNTDSYRGDWYFDIDSADLEKSYQDLLFITDTLDKRFRVGYKVWFSGKKGFHIKVPYQQYITDDNFYPDLPKVYKRMSKMFFSNLECLDMSVYSCGKGRMWRVSGDFREETGYFKTQLPRDVVKSGLQKILEYSRVKKPDFDVEHYFSDELNTIFIMLTLNSKVKVEAGAEVDGYDSSKPVADCISKVLEGVNIREDVTFNDLVLLLSTYFQKYFDVGIHMADDFLKLDTSDYLAEPSSSYTDYETRKSHLELMLKYAKDVGYKFSCGFARKCVKNIDCHKCDFGTISINGLMAVKGAYHKLVRDLPVQISNFIIEPTYKVETPSGDTVIDGNFIIEGKRCKFRSKLDKSCLKELKAFNMFTDERCWFSGTGTDVQKIGSYIFMQDLAKIKLVNKMGLHRWGGDWYYIDKSGAVNKEFKSTYNIQLERSELEVKLLGKDPKPFDVKKHLWFNNPRDVAAVLGWVTSCFIKPRLQRVDGSKFMNFPVLMISGLSGSGKTETASLLKRVFGYTDAVANYNSTTLFVKEKEFSSSNLHPIFIDELKKNLGNRSIVGQVQELIRQVYGSIEGKKGTASQKLRHYKREAPMVLIGEELLDEKASEERLVTVWLTEDSAKLHTEDYLVWKEADLEYIGTEILRTVLSASDAFLIDMYNDVKDLVAEYAPKTQNRQRYNLELVSLGAVLFGVVFDCVVEMEEAITQYLSFFNNEFLTVAKSDVGSFFQLLMRAADNNNFSDFDLRYNKRAKRVEAHGLIYDSESTYLNISRLYDVVIKYKNYMGLNNVYVTDLKTLTKALNNSKALISRESKLIKVAGVARRYMQYDNRGLEALGVELGFLNDVLEG
jgi:hypothetical protein